MARRRYISTEISLDKAFGKMCRDHGDFAGLLYLMLLPHAMDDCVIPRSDDPDELLAMVMPFRREVTNDQCADALSALASSGLLIRGDDGLLMFPPDSFYKYQTYINKDNRRGQSVGEERRETPKNAEKQRKTPKNAVSLSPSLSPSPSKDNSSSKPDDAFAEFWAAYPRKVGKHAALKAWAKAVKQTPADHIVKAVSGYPFDYRDGGQFIPHPSTWLNEGRWDDEVIPFQPTKKERDILDTPAFR